MKHKLSHYGLTVYLICLLFCVSACSKRGELTPVPTNAAATTMAISKARKWFQNQPRKSTKPTTAARDTGAFRPAIDWEYANYSQEYVVAPFAVAGTSNSFGESHKYGYRFLVVYLPADSSLPCLGRIAELITDMPVDETGQAANLALAGTKPLLAGKMPGSVVGLTGSLLIYSPAYSYETGLAYRDGSLQPLSMRIQAPPAPGTCYDYYLVGYDNTGAMVVHDFLYEWCTGGIPPLGGGWGGGGGGGGGPGTGPQQVATITPLNLKPCQATVLQDLLASCNSTTRFEIIQLFSGSDPDYNWIIKNGSNQFGHMGDTSPRFNFATNSVTTTFDGMQMAQATDL